MMTFQTSVIKLSKGQKVCKHCLEHIFLLIRAHRMIRAVCESSLIDLGIRHIDTGVELK